MNENVDTTDAIESNLALRLLTGILDIGSIEILNSQGKCNIILNNVDTHYNIALNKNDINQLINELLELKKKMAVA